MQNINQLEIHTGVFSVFRLAFANRLHGFIVLIEKDMGFCLPLIEACFVRGRLVLVAETSLDLARQFIVELRDDMFPAPRRQCH